MALCIGGGVCARDADEGGDFAVGEVARNLGTCGSDGGSGAVGNVTGRDGPGEGGEDRDREIERGAEAFDLRACLLEELVALRARVVVGDGGVLGVVAGTVLPFRG